MNKVKAKKEQKSCRVCGKTPELFSRKLGVCLECIRSRPGEALKFTAQVHAQSRKEFGLPSSPPRDPKGKSCTWCVNQCQIPIGGKGYCGLRTNQHGKLAHLAGVRKAVVSWYHDPLPTNCVADWVCPAGSDCGYPRFSYAPGPEYGYTNLAVFFGACTFDCLFCQNWHYRNMSQHLEPLKKPGDLAEAIDMKTACICYFGGDPTPQLPYAFTASKMAIDRASNRILRICWETNGTMNPKFRDRMAEISLKTGGCIKFDMKCWDENLNIALSNTSNKQTLENFANLAKRSKERPEPPFLIASTLLIPGYIDTKEVSNIATFISSLNPEIPYSLLAFYPCFEMDDLPTTSWKHAEECIKAAREAGLKKVKIGNAHLLSAR